MKIEGGSVKGSLRVDIVAWDGLDSDDLDLGRIKPTVFTLDAVIGSEAGGTATVANPGIGWGNDGEVVAVYEPLQRPRFKKAPDFGVLATERLTAIYAYGMQVWHELRTVEMAARIGLPYKLALDQIPEIAFEWPDPAEQKPADKPAARVRRGSVPNIMDMDIGLDSIGGDLLDDTIAADLAQISLSVEQIIAFAEPKIEHLQRYVAAARTAWNERAEAPRVLQCNVESGDPDFTASNNSEPIPADGTVIRLPDTLGRTGAVRWMYPRQEQVMSLGPVMTTPWGGHSPALPALIPERRTLYRAPVAAIRARGGPRSGYQAQVQTPAVDPSVPDQWGKDWGRLPDGATHHVRPWDYMAVMPMQGRFYAPRSARPNYIFPGWEYTGSYHAMQVEAPRDVEVWCTVETAYAAKLFVNNRLVWKIDRYRADPVKKPGLWLTRLPLKKGINELLLYVDDTAIAAFAGIHFCVEGAPRPPAEAQAIAAKRRDAYQNIGNPHSAARQFRRDHSGRYPDTNPPLAFDINNNRNIGWIRKLAFGNGNVMVMGDLLITTEAPNTVVALDKMTGEVRWRSRVDRLAVTHPEVWCQVVPVYAEIDALDPVDRANKERIEQLYEQLVALYPADYRRKPQFGGDSGYTDNIMCSPITDGHHLWIKQAGTVLAKLDAAGRIQWIIDMGAVGGSMGFQVNSPVFHDGRIIAMIAAYGTEPPTLRQALGGWCADRNPNRRARLVCHDAASGEKLWETPPFDIPHWGNRYDADGIVTPHVVSLTDGQERMDVIVTAGGQVWRADDGQSLINFIGHENVSHPYLSLGNGTLMIFSKVHFYSHVVAVRLIMKSRDEVRAETLWTGQSFNSFGYGGGVEHDGLIFGIASTRRGRLAAFDSHTGELMVNFFPVFRHAVGNTYPMPAMAGGALYLFCDGRIRYNRDTRFGLDQRHRAGEDIEYPEWLGGSSPTVLPGRDPLVLARNQKLPADGLTYGPEVDGDRMYFRLRGGVLCIQADEAGLAWQADKVAETLLAQLPGTPLSASDPLLPTQIMTRRMLNDDNRRRAAQGTMHFINGQVLRGWHTIGPLPVAEAGGIEAHVANGRLNWVEPDRSAGSEFRRFPLQDASRDFRRGWNEALTPEDSIERDGVAFCIKMAHAEQTGTALYWLGAVVVREQKTLRWDCPGEHVRGWIGGTAIEHGQRITLTRGTWQIVLRTELAPGDSPPPIRPRLWDSSDLAAEHAFVTSRLTRMRPFFAEAQKRSQSNNVLERIQAAESQFRMEQ